MSSKNSFYGYLRNTTSLLIHSVWYIYNVMNAFFRHVDDRILMILRKRFLECRHYEGPDGKYKCKPLKDTYDNAAIDWFIKCK